MTAQPHGHVRFRRGIERGALCMAEDAARERLSASQQISGAIYTDWDIEQLAETLLGAVDDE